MPLPAIVGDLIRRFTEQRETYTSPAYNETQVRREFLDPFFEALGWDVANRQGFAEAYKDVVHEDAVKVGTATKAPDYSFRIGRERKFFVEAKRPAVNIHDDPDPAFQLRRYAWSAKLPLSILTDFEEFAVYDCRVKPDKNDKASVGRVLYIKYTEYEERWEEIAGIFAKESVLKGSFDKYATDKRKKQGTAEVDSAFLADIEAWRDVLARNIALRNSSLSTRELNFAVQRTIDRLIFLRICEDRGIEDYGKLQQHLNGESVYKRLCVLFRYADDRYNSGLFHFKEEKGRDEAPDNITLNLSIDDKILKDMIAGLYYPESPYEFSVLPADILGQVYEQFLGKVIRLTPGHQAKVEDKPEVRKAGGVFYTPTYIVEYIVKNTVGKLLNPPAVGSPLPALALLPALPLREAGRQAGLIKGGKTVKEDLPSPPACTDVSAGRLARKAFGPKQAEGLRILDPACGSGSFLIGAYQYLLDWHRDWYVNDGPDKWIKGKEPRLYKARSGEYRLTSPERKRILINNIYGVDIDTQAVEVTKLSLLLKVLEGETEQSISQQLTFLHQRALPDLGSNIKCGNSLIGTDFYQGMQESMVLYEDADEERIKINAFDWDGKHGFHDIMKAGGFDAVIGNPPYVRQEMLGDFKEYFQRHYEVFQGTADLYSYFIERGVKLLNERGIFSIIVANKWMRANYGEPLRKWLKNQAIHEIVDFGDLPVFQTATTYPCIITLSKKKANAKTRICKVDDLEFSDLDNRIKEKQFFITQNSFQDSGWSLSDNKSQALLNKLMAAGMPLSEYVGGKIYYGIKTGLNEAFVINEEIKKRLIGKDKRSAEVIKPFLMGRNVFKYHTASNGLFLILIPKGWTLKIAKNSAKAWDWFEAAYPAIADHLRHYEKAAAKRFDQGNFWWELRTCEYYDEFSKPKIIVPAITQNATYCFDSTGFYSNDKTTIIACDSPYLLGLLNSKAIDYVMHSISSTKQGGYYEYKPMYLSRLPIRSIDFKNRKEKDYHETMVSFVASMLDLHRRLPLARTDQEKAVISRQIDSTDRRIDELVYELYGLTEEEIRIVEGM